MPHHYLIDILLQINDALNRPWWSNYDFWALILSFLNVLVLGLTFFLLIKSTKATEVSARATEKMTNEMLKQRLYEHAHDVDFVMKSYYLPHIKDGLVTGEIMTKDEKNKITFFAFLDSKYLPIGKAGRFYKILSTDIKERALYRMETDGERRTFLETLQKGKGFIKAKVIASSGTEFIYTYKAITDNWRNFEIFPPEANYQYPNLRDNFSQASKQIDPEFLNKIIKDT